MFEAVKLYITSFFKSKDKPKSFIPTTFPNKSGQSSLTCTPLLSIHASLFCTDNYNILFKDANDNMKVIKPVNILPRTEGRDFDAYDLDDGFAIRYGDYDYFYQAKFDVVPVYNIFMIKLRDIKQPVHSVEVEGDHLTINSTGE